MSNAYRTTFHAINERPVDDISLEFFYKPHTLTLLSGVIAFLVYSAFTRDDSSRDENIWMGAKSLIFFFLVFSVLAFPNGPFTRPHPAIWRMVFGMSVLYLCLLQLSLFQNYKDIITLFNWMDPNMNLTKSVVDAKDYAVNCSDVSLLRLWRGLDYFAYAHFAGWVLKATLIRHYGICWFISVFWEITELFFAHLLPNFQECWWDAIILDILLCNGMGIWLGMFICKKLEMRTFHWESIKNIPSTTGKLTRAVMQFTPVSWTHVRWLDPTCTHMRVLAVWKLVVIWLIGELNTFFLKHIFNVETEHPVNTIRIFLIGAIAAPSIRQYYTYVTDPLCYRVGTQAWVYCAITLTEAIICVKFGRALFATAQLRLIVMWLFVLFVGSIVVVYLSHVVAKRSTITQEVNVNGELQHRYLDSSVENIMECTDDTELRHRRPDQRERADSITRKISQMSI